MWKKRSWMAMLAAITLFGCGGEAEPIVRPPGRDAVPLVASLASPSGGPAAQLRAGDLGGARAAFELALAQDPDRLDALNDLAVNYTLQGRFESARALLDEVVAHGGSREQQAALVNLGELHALEGYLSAAQAHFESARSIDPTRPEAWYALALLADVRGDRAAASSQLREAVRLDEAAPRRDGPRAGLAYVHPEERLHLEALLLELSGDRDAAAARWRELKAGRFAALSELAERRLGED